MVWDCNGFLDRMLLGIKRGECLARGEIVAELGGLRYSMRHLEST